MNSPTKTNTKFRSLLSVVRNDFPLIKFNSSDMFRWSDETHTIYYDPRADDPVWSLLHELGHMDHLHNIYNSDTALIRMELEAWESAKEFAEKYKIVIDEEHIQD